MFRVTQAAQIYIRSLNLSVSDKCIRFGIKSGGCSGFEYTTELVPCTSIHKYDLKLHQNTFLDSVALMHIKGLEIDYKTDIFQNGFKFNVFNGPGSHNCGCGKSFS
jgi:iron-sulfur cluster assembly accessory protein